MQKNRTIISGLLIIVCVITGCTLFGLDLQENYDYHHSYYDNELNMDAWAFIQSRPDLFSGLMEAINYVKDTDPSVESMFRDPDNTYMLLTNTALIDITNSNAYFTINRKLNPDYDAGNPDDVQYFIPTSWTQFDKKTVIELLKYHVVKGLHGYEQLNSTPRWYDTYSPADTAKLNIYLSASREGYVYVNNYVGVPTLTIPGTTTKVTFNDLRPRTPNLKATNGIIHVMDRWVFPPTKEILGL